MSCHRIGKGRGSIRFTEAQVGDFLQSCEVGASGRRSGSKFTHPRK